ncbi:MAG: ATP-dependent helicase RecG [Solirubrobacterales bacterium]|jgi:ATP-dependent DNA helicase RecG|nr:ATP-dependent helicase RecG [Solirubrobacterales bacterium]
MEAATQTVPVAATPDPPAAFGTAAPQDRASLLAAPLRCAPRPSRLDAPLTQLHGAGPKLAALAAEIGLERLEDLLWHVPHGYRDRRMTTPVAKLAIGAEATIEVELRSIRVRPTRRRGLKIVEAAVADSSGPLTALWFNQAWLAEKLAPGSRLLLNGKLDKRGFRVAAHELVGADGDAPAGLHTTGIVPVHPASEGLRPQKLREWAWQALGLAGDAVEGLPAGLRARRGLAGAADAFAAAHFPASDAEAADGLRRLAFEELFLYQAALAMRRRDRDDGRRSIRLGAPAGLVGGWLESLPFALTGDQSRAIDKIDADLTGERPMQRLLMGEVGSGKTIVALYAMLRAAEAGHQAALMAPTETLAEQHFATLERLLGPQGPPVALLTGSTPLAERRERMSRLASGDLGLAVGTHALIERGVEFRSLAVAVVDEQHRFGVRQRASLDAKAAAGAAPHVLHMTATPIPRTLSLTAYGDLDTTTLRELPAGRQAVETRIVREPQRAAAYEFVRERLREGRQAFVVCPLVTESDKLQAKAASEEARRLAAGELREFRVDCLHGQMRSADKQAAMGRFAAGETQVLVATSVIEVGIDVANATVIVIESAERYGLSQLHQLRGRVGRGEHSSRCLLFPAEDAAAASPRLDAIARERDGFKLAEVDLSLRGEGEILGTRQHGLPRFRVADLPDDLPVLLAAREEALALIREHGSFEAPALGPLAEAVRRRFGDERAPLSA